MKKSHMKNKSKRKQISNLLAAAFIQVALLLAPVVRAVTCPMLAQGGFYGAPNWNPDDRPDPETATTIYRYITDDDFAQIVSIFYCLDAATQTSFQGFIATFKNTNTGALTSLPYGNVKTGNDVCQVFFMQDEIQWIQVKKDDNVIKGLAMGNYASQIPYTFKTVDIPSPDPRDSPFIPLPGRLIGFGITMDKFTSSTDQFVRISMVYNSCNCVGSTFVQDQPPTPMRIKAVLDAEVTQVLVYRQNVIERSFGQDCGGQTVSLIARISPSPLDLSVYAGASGILSPKNENFPNLIRVGAASLGLIGRWDFALKYFQNPGQGSVNAQGQESLMPPVVFPFFVQVDPCPITEFIPLTPLESISYTVGDGLKETQAYLFQQNPKCGYDEVIAILDSPNFVAWDQNKNSLLINTSDLKDVGVYHVKVQRTIQVPTDYSKISFTEHRAQTTVTFVVTCSTATLGPFLLFEMSTVVNGDEDRQDLPDVQDSAGGACGPVQFELINGPSYSSHLILDGVNKMIRLQSVSQSDIGKKTVYVKAFLANFPDVNETTSFEVTVQPCTLKSFTVTMPSFKYVIGSGKLKSDSFEVIPVPAICSYESTASFAGLPAFISTDVNSLIVETSDRLKANSYEVSLSVTIKIPTDYTLSSFQYMQKQAPFTITAEDPCRQTSLNSFLIENVQLNVLGPKASRDIPFQVTDSASQTFGNRDGMSFCGERTYTIEQIGMYSGFLTVNEAAKKMEFLTSQPGNVGQYQIEMTVQLVEYPKITQSSSFTVTINPCHISKFIGSFGSEKTQIYTVSASELMSSNYNFTQTDSCGYKESIEVQNMPAFVTHDPSAKKFIIFTDNPSHSGTYKINVVSTIKVPDDYTLSTYTTMTSQVEFNLTVIADCSSTGFVTWNLSDTNWISSVLEDAQIINLGPVYDSVSQINGNKDGLTSCGKRLYRIINQAAVSGFLNIDDANETLVLKPKDVTDEGLYQVEVEVSLKDFQKIKNVSILTVQVNPCKVLKFEGSLTDTMLLYTVNTLEAVGPSYWFTQTRSCDYIETIEVQNMPAFVKHDPSAQRFSIFTDDPLSSGTYKINVLSSIKVPDDYTRSTYTTMTSQVEFTYTVVADCTSTKFDKWMLPHAKYTSSVLEDAQIINLGPVYDSVSQINGNQDGLTFCGQRLYRIIDQTVVSGFLSIDDSNETLVLLPKAVADEGLFQLKIEVSLQDFPKIKYVAEISVQVNPCQVFSLKGSVTDTPLQYSVNTPATVGAFYQFIQMRNCGYAETLTVTDLPAFVTHNSSAKSFTVQTSDPLDKGSYIVSLGSRIKVPTDYSRSSFTEISSPVVTLEIKVFDECGVTVFDDLILADMTVFVLGPSQSQSLDQVKDQASKLFGNKDGFSFCGARSYELVDPVSHEPYLQFADRTITVKSTSKDDIKVHQVQVKVSLDGRPNISKIATFSVIIDPCKVSSFKVTGPSDQSYQIQNPTKSLGFLTASQGFCNYPVTYQLMQPMPFISIDTLAGEVTVQTDNLSLEGLFKIQIQGSIQQPSLSDQNTFIAYESAVSFNLKLSKYVDPCSLSVLDTLTLPDMQTSVLGQAATQTFQEVQDSESKVSGDKSGTTYCGPRVYSFVGSHGGFSFDQATRHIVLASSDQADVGKFTVKLQVQLQNYPQITTFAQFNITISPCEVTSFKVTGPSDSAYTIAQTVKSLGFLTVSQGFCNYPVAYQLVQPMPFIIIDTVSGEVSVQTDDLSQEGLFKIQIQGIVQQPSLSNPNTFIAYESVASFHLKLSKYVDPCSLSVLDTLTLPDMQTSVLGQAATQTFQEVQDSESKVSGDKSGTTYCGPRVYSFVGSHGGFSFDQATRQIVLASSDQADVGKFTVKLQVQLQNYPQITTFAQFYITISPCKITQFIGNIDPKDITLNRGDMPKTTFGYIFSQMNSCSYSETITIDKSLSFITHNKNTKDFTILTAGKSHVGVYQVTVQSTISVPDDYTLLQFTKVSSEVSFKVTIVDPCFQTEILPFSITDLISYAPGEVYSRTLPIVQDTISLANDKGNGDFFCGKRNFEVVGDMKLIDFANDKINFYTMQAAVNTDYNLEIRVSLADYPGVKPSSFTVYAITKQCELTSLTPPANRNLTYYIRTKEITLQLPAFIKEPADCQQPLVYKFSLEDGSQIPQWITSDAENRILRIESKNLQNQGKYTLVLTGSTTDNYQYTRMSKTVSITLIVKFDCAQDEITALNKVSDQMILLEDSGAPQRLTPQFAQYLDSCPKSFSLQKLQTTGWSTLSPDESTIIKILNTGTGEIGIGTDLRILDGKVWNVRLTVTNSAGTQYASVEFDVTFKDACWVAVLSPPQFAQTIYSFELYKDQLLLKFTPMKISKASCGPASYELVYVSGSVSQSILRSIDLTSTTFSSQLNNRRWIGTHQFRIKGFNGQNDPSSTIGQKGIFGTALSDQVTVNISDPCVDTIIKAANIFPDFLSVPPGQTSSYLELKGPKNSVSELYGNGYDLCGPITYTVLDQSGQVPQSSNFFLKSQTDMTTGDNLTLKLESAAGDGPKITQKLLIKIGLTEVSAFSPLLISINVTYRECKVENYKAPKIEDQILSYLSLDPIVIFLDFDQSPCIFNQSYKAFLVKGNEEVPLPDFIKLSLSQSSITISSPKNFGMLGDYIVKLQSVLSNSLNTTSSSNFTVSIINEPQNISPFDVKPKFNLLLRDQVVTVGHSLVYPINFIIEDNGVTNVDAFKVHMSLNLAKIKRFAKFDSFTHTLKIDGSKLTDADTGFYTLEISATFFDGTQIVETLIEKFRLEVRAKPQIIWPPDKNPKDNPIGPEKVIYISDWTGLIEDIDQKSVFSNQQPIPFVKNLSETGVLTIGWDRRMQHIANVTEVPPMQVILRQKQKRNLDDFLLGDYYGSIDGFQKVTIRNAVEVQLVTADQDDKILNWSVVESTSETFKIQINFDPEDLISDHPQTALIRVTLWGIKYFKSMIDGVEVRLGTTLQWPILNQIATKQSSYISTYRDNVRYAFAGIILLMVPFYSLGTLLPTWMFLNTLQILAHLPLLSAQLPPLANSVLLELLSIVKFDWIFPGELKDQVLEFDASSTATSFNSIRLACSYTDVYASYITLALLAAIGVSLVQMLISYCFRLCFKNFGKGCFSMSNITLRLIYFFFLEVSLSLFINIALISRPPDEEYTSRTYLIYYSSLAISAFLALLFITLLICALFGIRPLIIDTSSTSPSQLSDTQKRVLIKYVRKDKNLYAFSKFRDQQPLQNEWKREQSGNPLYLETQATARKLLTDQPNFDTEEMGKDDYFFTQGDAVDIQKPCYDEEQAPITTPFENQDGNQDRLIIVSQIDSGRSKHSNELTENLNFTGVFQDSRKSPPAITDLQKMMLRTFVASSLDLGTSEGTYEEKVSRSGSGIGMFKQAKVTNTNTISRPGSTCERQIEQALQGIGKEMGHQRHASVFIKDGKKGGFGNGNMYNTQTTDEFLTDKISVELQSVGRLEREIIQELQKSPGRFGEPSYKGLKTISPVRENAELAFKNETYKYGGTSLIKVERQQLEGGESEIQSSVRLSPRSSQAERNCTRDSHASMNVSVVLRRASNRRDGAKTRQNERRTDFAACELSFENFNRRKLSESVRVNHDYETITETFSKCTIDKVSEARVTQTLKTSNSDQNKQEQDLSKEDEIVLDTELLAKIKTKFEQKIELNSRYKTLFYGLRLDHISNVVVTHPLLFLIRRILFVASMIVLVDYPLFAVLAFIILTLGMLAYSLHQKQWQDSSIRKQNIFNEVILYQIATLFFFCRGNLTNETQSIVGLILVGLVGALILVNFLIMACAGLRGCMLCIVRIFGLCVLKRRKSQKKALRQEVSSFVRALRSDLVSRNFLILSSENQDRQKKSQLIRVHESRTSLWNRIFGRKVQQTGNERIELDDDESLQLVQSSSGGFKLRFKNYEVRGAEIDYRNKYDTEYDPMGVFSNGRIKREREMLSYNHSNQFPGGENAEVISESCFKTNSYSQQDRNVLSDFEFQSHGGENMPGLVGRGTIPLMRRSFGSSHNGMSQYVLSNNGGRQTPNLLSKTSQEIDQSYELDQSILQSPDEQKLNRRRLQLKPYLQNGLNTILQVNAIEEETPSVATDPRNRLSPQGSTLINSHHRFEKRLNFEQGLRQDDCEIKPYIGRDPFQDALEIAEEGDGELSSPWNGLRVQEVKQQEGISVVHEVDEASNLSFSRTPGSCIKIHENSGVKNQCLESSEATFECGSRTFRPNLTDDCINIKEFNANNVEENNMGEVRIAILSCNDNEQSIEMQNKTLSPARLKFEKKEEPKSPYRVGMAQNTSTQNSISPSRNLGIYKSGLLDKIDEQAVKNVVFLMNSLSDKKQNEFTTRNPAENGLASYTVPAPMVPNTIQKSKSAFVAKNITNAYNQTSPATKLPSPCKQVPEASKSSANVSFNLMRVPQKNPISTNDVLSQCASHEDRFISPAKSSFSRDKNQTLLSKQGTTYSIQSGRAPAGQRLTERKNNVAGLSPFTKYSQDSARISKVPTSQILNQAAQRDINSSAERSNRATSLVRSNLARSGANMLNILKKFQSPEVNSASRNLQQLAESSPPKVVKEGGPTAASHEKLGMYLERQSIYLNQQTSSSRQNRPGSKQTSPGLDKDLTPRSPFTDHMQKVVQDFVKVYTPNKNKRSVSLIGLQNLPQGQGSEPVEKKQN